MKALLKMLPRSERNSDHRPSSAALLVACPFCGAKGFLGAEAVYCNGGRAGEMDYAIRCGSCDCTGPWAATAFVAASLWNKREAPRTARRGRQDGPALPVKLISTTVALMFCLMPLKAATVIDNNPGYLDDPACRGLVVAQLKAQNQKLEDWMVEYFKSVMMTDNEGAVNIYHVTNRKNGQVWEIAVALHSEQVQTK